MAQMLDIQCTIRLAGHPDQFLHYEGPRGTYFTRLLELSFRYLCNFFLHPCFHVAHLISFMPKIPRCFDRRTVVDIIIVTCNYKVTESLKLNNNKMHIKCLRIYHPPILNGHQTVGYLIQTLALVRHTHSWPHRSIPGQSLYCKEARGSYFTRLLKLRYMYVFFPHNMKSQHRSIQ